MTWRKLSDAAACIQQILMSMHVACLCADASSVEKSGIWQGIAEVETGEDPPVVVAVEAAAVAGTSGDCSPLNALLLGIWCISFNIPNPGRQ